MKPRFDVFQGLVEEQLDQIPGLRFRRMFGGHGIYANETFFGIIHKEQLCFHTDDRTKKRYEHAGMTFFTAPGSKKALKWYYEVPLAVVELKSELTEWAREAIESAE